ncbi:MAG TPA: riboflavin biosynthesis protein RibF [Bacillota bacterium]|nr:riboflavin biosynthesis protein RibF [Bacillota bacterium]
MNTWMIPIHEESDIPSVTGVSGTSERAVALGFFDGVHRGHQCIFSVMMKRAEERKLKTGVQTFATPPSSKRQSPMLTTYKEKCEIIEKTGVDDILALPFNDAIQNMHAEQFLTVCVARWMRARVIVVGEDYRFGANREGNIDMLKAWGARNGIEIIAVPAEKYRGRVISSTWIRECVKDGNIELAHLLLGRPMTYHGIVEQGHHLGRTLGFPTANIRIGEEKTIPRFGVYASRYTFNGTVYPSITNIGMRPTVNRDDCTPIIETMLYGVDSELYGTNGTVELLAYVRPERVFPDVQGLKAQVDHDKEEVWHYHNTKK